MLVAGGLAHSAHAAATETPAKPVVEVKPAALQEMVILKSAFSDDKAAGKDPFFPKSGRRNQAPPDQFQSTPLLILSQLSLKGISGTKDKRLALINNRTLEVGEESEFRQGNQSVKIRCVEITDKSVFITVEGSPDRKELRLRGQ